MTLTEALHGHREGWATLGATRHPTGDQSEGMLVHHLATGRYALDVLGVLRSVPQHWARAEADRHVVAQSRV